MNGHHSETMFSRDNRGKAGQWLVDEAARNFPKGVSVASSGASVARPPARPVNPPSHGLPAPRAPEAVVAGSVHCRPRRFVDRHMVDLPRRLARDAEQEGQRVFTTNRQKHGWLDRDRPRAAADITSVADLAAAKSGCRETAVAKMLGSGINRAVLEATRTIDRRLEIERGYFAKRRERQRVKFAATLFLRHDRLRFREPDPLVPE